MAQCDISECPDPVLARKWCRKHYKRWETHGDPLGPPAEDRERPGENWLPIAGWEGLYEISDHGRVWSVRYRRLLKPVVGGWGYLKVTLCAGKSKQVGTKIHVLVAAAFLGPRPDGLVLRHLDGDKLNNRVTNLTYGTQAENLDDAMRHGTHRNAVVRAREECVNHHPYSPGTFYFNAAGSKVCRTCDKEKTARYLARKRARAA